MIVYSWSRFKKGGKASLDQTKGDSEEKSKVVSSGVVGLNDDDGDDGEGGEGATYSSY